MAEPTDFEVPKGSFAAGRRVRLPRGAEKPVVVYINGVAQEEGSDYEIRRGEVVFKRPILKEKVGVGRWMAMYLGLFGTYRKDEKVDLQFTRESVAQLSRAYKKKYLNFRWE